MYVALAIYYPVLPPTFTQVLFTPAAVANSEAHLLILTDLLSFLQSVLCVSVFSAAARILLDDLRGSPEPAPAAALGDAHAGHKCPVRAAD